MKRVTRYTRFDCRDCMEFTWLLPVGFVVVKSQMHEDESGCDIWVLEPIIGDSVPVVFSMIPTGDTINGSAYLHYIDTVWIKGREVNLFWKLQNAR